MKLARFPALGVAVGLLTVILGLGGCNGLSSAPAAFHDGGRDSFSQDGIRPGEAGPALDSAAGFPGDGGLVIQTDVAESDGRAADGPSTLISDVMVVSGLDTAPGFDSADGAGGAGGADDASPTPEDAILPNETGPVLADTALPVDGVTRDDAVLLVFDTLVDNIRADSLVASDTRDTYLPPDALGGTFTIDLGAQQTVCGGWHATLGSSPQGGVPPYTYSWKANPTCLGCISDPAAAQPEVTPASTTTFTVTVTDSLGATATDSVKVTVQDGIADAGPETVSVDPAAPIKIGTPGLAGYTYAWTCDRPACALSSRTVAQPSASPSLSTLYTLTVTSPEGCTATDSTTVWVNLPVTTTPSDGETRFSASAPLLVQFGAGLLASSITSSSVTLRESDSGTPVTFTTAYNSSLRILSITPTGLNYRASTGQFTLTLVGGAAGIVSDNALRPQRLPADVVVHFSLATTTDLTRPTIASRTPANFAIGVGLDVAPSATFSEALDPATVTAADFAVWSGMTTVPGTLSYDTKTFTIQFVPTTQLAVSTTYTVRVSGIQDLSGNTILSTYWTFTTGTTGDTTPPTVLSVSPAAATTAVGTNAAVVITFSEAMNATTVANSIQVSAGASAVSGTVSYDAGTLQATFSPSAQLAKLTLYTVTVTGAKDLAGNALATPFTSTFTTANGLFADSFESGTANWTLGAPWGRSTDSAQSATHSLADSPAGNYAANANTSATSIPIDVTGVTSATLSYWVTGQTQSSADYLRVEVSTNGTTWTSVDTLYGSLEPTVYSHPLTLAATVTQLQIRFRFISNAIGQADGVYIDDVLLQAN
ncbi:MAG TPA: Ig-like domain-containing protein [Polyangia bacterium]